MLSNAQAIMNEVPPPPLISFGRKGQIKIPSADHHTLQLHHVLNTMINHQNALATSVQTLESRQATTTTDLAAQGTAQTDTEAALRSEINTLRHEQTEAANRSATQISELRTENQQLRTSLQNLTLANQEMLEQLMQLTSRFNELDTRSNSFYASSRAPTEVGDDD